MEFVVNANPVTTLSIAKRNLPGILESIVVFLDLGLFGPFQLGEDFDALIGELG